MEEQKITDDVRVVSEEKKEEEQKGPDFPRSESVIAFYDREKKMYWLGIPLDRVDQIGVRFFMQDVTPTILAAHLDCNRRPKIIKPQGFGTKLGEFLRHKK